MSARPLPQRVWWSTSDYVRRVWDNAGEDNLPFLAGGIAFNILLAIVPFLFLLLAGLGYILEHSDEQSVAELWAVIDWLLPPTFAGPDSPTRQIMNDVVRTRGAVGVTAFVLFVWFSTRLFGSLRTVLGEVFDIEQDRGIISGKLFDIQITLVATLLFVIYTLLSAYLQAGTTRGVLLLTQLGIRTDVMGRVEFVIASATAFIFIVAIFFALYKVLPNRRIRWQAAMIAALFTGTLFEVAKFLFTRYVTNLSAGTIYTGTLYAIVIVVFWVYYAALIFVLGGEVGQVYELRRVRRLQREAFEE
jgi:membrane protein